ncbi:Uncharacterized protein (Fragment) [Durusdinium trenchii]|uniref:Cyclic nucleotide-binding domain-containing protein n=1 Tax=Durusdinium trenchii TaxID=1381693 RepID=A0ABP0PJ98_9DINO
MEILTRMTMRILSHLKTYTIPERIKCSSGETIKSPGSMTIFGDEWRYKKIRCLETRELMEPFMRSKAQVLALNTRNNQELPGYRMEVLSPGDCNTTQWPFNMAFNKTLVNAAQSFMQKMPTSFIAVHWRHGTSMHVDSDQLVQNVNAILQKYTFKPQHVFLSTNCQETNDLLLLEKQLALPMSQFKDDAFAPWQRALIDIIIASEAPYFIPSSSSSSFAKVFQREMKHKLMELGKLIDVKEDINLEQQATQCDALKNVPFFSDPSDAMHEFVAELAMNTSTYWYKPGKVLVEEGDTNCEEMFILLRGSCEVYSCGQLLGRIENDVIGEIGVLDLLERRTATVKTATACQCMKLSRQVMVPILAKYPEARLRMLELARQRLTSINESINAQEEDVAGSTQDLCGRLPGCAIGFGPHVNSVSGPYNGLCK